MTDIFLNNDLIELIASVLVTYDYWGKWNPVIDKNITQFRNTELYKNLIKHV